MTRGAVLDLLLAGSTWLVAVLLVLFGTRRLLFLAATFAPPRVAPANGQPPTLVVVVPARNEENTIGTTLTALEQLDYPADRLQIVLVDDGSSDGTRHLLTAFAERLAHVSVVPLKVSAGKASALNAALSAAAGADLVAVCDADQAPHPDSFRLLVRALADPSVGAAFGYLAPVNADASAIARYAAVETWVHQLVTSAAKDRLDLNPPSLGGGSVYRREALDQIRGFPSDAFGEDIETSVLLSLSGWRTRFLREAVISNQVVANWQDYWRQHIRWARTVLRASRRQRHSAPIPLARRIEAIVQTGGYLDRLALAGSVPLVLVGSLPVWIPACYVGLVALEVGVAIQRGGAGRRALRFLLATVAGFPLDVVATFVAVGVHLSRRPLIWDSPRREVK